MLRWLFLLWGCVDRPLYLPETEAIDLAAPDLAMGPDVALPDLAVPDLTAWHDLSAPDLSAPEDLALPPPDLTGADLLLRCDRDDECDDSNRCNGSEACDRFKHLCISGSSWVEPCAPPNGCVSVNLGCSPGQNGEASGCHTYAIVDDTDLFLPSYCGSDCNDRDPTIYPGAAELCDGKDNDCDGLIDEEPPLWRADCDRDGYAPAGAEAHAGCAKPGAPPAACPKGDWTTAVLGVTGEGGRWNATDCDDGNPGVNLSVRYPIASPVPNNGNFDWNCDGIETLGYPRAGVAVDARCFSYQEGGCSGASGWAALSPAPCGGIQSFSYCKLDGVWCRRVVEMRKQTCY